MMNLRLLISNLLLAAGMAANALMGQSLTDSLPPSTARKIKPYLSFDSRNSFVASRRANFIGVKAGITDGAMRWGLGFYLMTTDIVLRFTSPQTPADTIPAKCSYWYFTYFLEPVPVRTKRFELSFPVNFGLGQASYHWMRVPVGTVPSPGRTVGILEPYVTAQYKVLPWLGVGAGGGYRKTLFAPGEVNRALDAPIYFVKVKFFAGVVLKKIKEKKREKQSVPE